MGCRVSTVLLRFEPSCLLTGRLWCPHWAFFRLWSKKRHHVLLLATSNQPSTVVEGKSASRYAASGTARALVSAQVSRARIARSAWSATRSIRRTRRGSSAHSCLSRPFSRSTNPRSRFHRAVPRGIRVCSRLAPIHLLAGEHSPVGQRHLAACRLASDPANVHSPCAHVGGLCLPALTAGVSRRGMTGWQSRSSKPT
jgi:hypothetical protein